MKGNSSVLLLGLVVFLGVFGFSNGVGLQMNFYQSSCPNAEQIVRNITWTLTAAEPDTVADLLRLHYHDCFVRGCDASILLDTAGGEKEADPNQSLGSGGFEAVDQIKTRLEQECPGIVSCSDILALAARDAVSFKFKRSMWDVLTGRRDGIASLSSEVTNNLPLPFSNFNTLQQLFARKRLNVLDLVALSGAHTIGTAHCSAFNRRLYNFTGKNDADPSLNSTYADVLRSQCTNPPNPTTTVEMDQASSLDFDTAYFVGLGQKKGLFQSDAALLTNLVAAVLVKQFQTQQVFFAQFGRSMQKMGAIEVLVGSTVGQIRKQCRAINP